MKPLKLKKSLDQQVVAKGYAIEVKKQDGYVSFRGGYGEHDFRMPDDYVMVTLNDDFGNEWYIFGPKSMEVGEA